MNFDEAARQAETLRKAILAMEDVERTGYLQSMERAKLSGAKNALEHALLRLAIAALEQEIDARQQRQRRLGTTED